MKVKIETEVTQSCPTLVTPWTAAYQAPPSMGFSRQEYWSGVPLPSPKQYLFTSKEGVKGETESKRYKMEERNSRRAATNSTTATTVWNVRDPNTPGRTGRLPG